MSITLSDCRRAIEVLQQCHIWSYGDEIDEAHEQDCAGRRSKMTEPTREQLMDAIRHCEPAEHGAALLLDNNIVRIVLACLRNEAERKSVADQSGTDELS